MRGHQSAVARLDNVFGPIESLFEDSVVAGSPVGAPYKVKRKQEELTRPAPSVAKYIEAESIGSARTTGQWKAMVGKKPLSAIRFLDQLRPKIQFLGTAIEESQLPLALLPEVAVVGRSNTGKSSVINALVGRRCCKVENKPGSTQELAFFKAGDPALISLVDVPGFGFAYADETKRSQWTEFALWYLRSRRNLKCALLIVDARHGLGESDLELVTFFKTNKIEWKLVLNKSDLVEARTLAKRVTCIAHDLQISPTSIATSVFPISALRAQGLDRLRRLVEQFKLKRDVVIAGESRRVTDLLEERRLRRLANRQDKAAREGGSQLKLTQGDLEAEKKIKSNSTQRHVFDLHPICQTEPHAYIPEAHHIVKKKIVFEPETDIRILQPEHFISKDEQRNLGLRAGRDLPRNEEIQMKTNHQLDWKMRLSLNTAEPTRPKGDLEPKKNSKLDEAALLGFITTFNPPEIPKGIAKWKVMGMKPRIKTGRFRSKPDMAASVVRAAN